MINFRAALPAYLQDQRTDDSHVEPDPTVLHPSQLAGNCAFSAYTGTLGLTEMEYPGPVHVGSLIHEDLEANFLEFLSGAPGLTTAGEAESGDALHAELSCERSADGITLTGTTDLYNECEDAITDFKTSDTRQAIETGRRDYYDQLQLYMWMLDAERGRIIHIARDRMDIQPDPDPLEGEAYIDRDDDRIETLLDTGREVAKACETHPQPTAEADIPFSRCGQDHCFCSQASLSFPSPDQATLTAKSQFGTGTSTSD